MYVCEDKSEGKALLHFYTINTFWLKREITSKYSKLNGKLSTAAPDQGTIEAFLKGIGMFTSLLVN